jgi:hypothetical protein
MGIKSERATTWSYIFIQRTPLGHREDIGLEGLIAVHLEMSIFDPKSSINLIVCQY